MAWAELTGSRQINDSLEYIDYDITFIGGTADPLPAQGALYGAVVGSGTLPSDGLVAEPEAVSISRRQKITALKSQVTVRFRGFKSGA
jgi:hypothetical protein